MAFIGVALLLAGGLALLINADAGSLVGLTQDQTGQLIPLLIILLFIASGLFGRRMKVGELLGGALMWAGMFAVIIAGYSYRFEIAGITNRVLGELTPGVAVVDSQAGTAVFRKGFGNTFYLVANVNETPVRMIFDTGASVVVLTERDAIAAGINTDHLRFNIRVQTANGTGRAAAIEIKQLDVGGIRRINVRALVAEPGALDTSLLGMSFLQTLSAYTVSKDSLELRG